MGLLDDTSGEPEVVRQIRRFRASLLAEDAVQQQEMVGHWLRIEQSLEADMERMANDFLDRLRSGKPIDQEALLQMGRYHDLLRQVRSEVYGFAEFASESVTEKQLEFGIRAIDNALQLIQSQRLDLLFNRLPIEAVEAMAGLAGDGSPLVTLLRKTWADAADGMTRQLLRGTALGWNPRKTAREMQKGMASGLNRAFNIARTEQLRVYRDVSRQQYQNSGVVIGYKRIAAKQDRTCPACLMADGKFYELDQVMEEHPSGRCALVPIVEGEAEVTWKQGRDWFSEQDESTQRKILGKGRYNAWVDGKFDLDELVTTKRNNVWGDSIQSKSLQDLTA